MQAYSDESRESDPYSLPDVEVFYVQTNVDGSQYDWLTEDGEPLEPGWYWWSCFPGCLPDSDPIGPFATEKEALADAQDIE
jgi:hypothetical protein